MSTDSTPTPRAWVPLSPRERRILGVLIEKQKTTPDGYPMSLSALVTGCNQKSNREPVTNYDADDVEETLEDLRRKGAVTRVEGSGRVQKWKHAAYDWLGLRNRPAEMAIVAELLLRGAQTEGELRGRASRMDPIPDLPALQTALEYLAERDLVIRLTPPGQRRGVVVTHGLYPPQELERVRQEAARSASLPDDEPTSAPTRSGSGSGSGGGGGITTELEALRARVNALEEQVQALQGVVNALKESLGG